jgi:hypothetical protein
MPATFRITPDGQIGPPWIQTSACGTNLSQIRCSDRQAPLDPWTRIPRVIIGDKWDFFTLVAGF